MDIRTEVLNFARWGRFKWGTHVFLVIHGRDVRATWFVDLVDFAAYGDYSPYKPSLVFAYPIMGGE